MKNSKLKNALRQIERPIQIEIPTKEFDKLAIENYTFKEVGKFWCGGEEVVILEFK